MTELYLICSGQTIPAERVTDPYSAALSPEGLAQAAALADACRSWQIEYLGVSTTLHAQMTADIIQAGLPGVLRRDMQDLEDLTLDDLNLDPTASHLPLTWTPEQRRAGLRQAWTRVAAALARVLLYAERNGVARVAIVAGKDVLGMLLLSHVDHGHRVDEQVVFQFDPGSSSMLTVLGDDRVRVGWVNRLP